jgi:hypothetical protein
MVESQARNCIGRPQRQDLTARIVRYMLGAGKQDSIVRKLKDGRKNKNMTDVGSPRSARFEDSVA